MTLKEFVRFAYGLFMGTSTPFLKPAKRYLFPSAVVKHDERLTLVLGGSGICAILTGEGQALVINTNQGEGARDLRALVEQETRDISDTLVVLSSSQRDFSASLAVYQGVRRVFVGEGGAAFLREAYPAMNGRVEGLQTERILEVGDERVWLIPIREAATGSDLVVFLEKRKMLFAGALFYNRIQPILHSGPGLRPQAWIEELKSLLERFKPEVVVPAEGDLAREDDVREFIAYLEALVDPAVEFNQCRARFDWPEIPSYTSLEENFDLIRGVKSHTTLG